MKINIKASKRNRTAQQDAFWDLFDAAIYKVTGRNEKGKKISRIAGAILVFIVLLIFSATLLLTFLRAVSNNQPKPIQDGNIQAQVLYFSEHNEYSRF